MSSSAKVVLFTGGPVLESGAREMIRRLDRNDRLDLVGVFCETGGRGSLAVATELFRRRGGLLAIPLLLQRCLRLAARWLVDPSGQLARRAAVARASGVTEYPRDIHSPAVLSAVAAADPDVGMIYGGPIVKPKLFEIPSRGTLGIHHGRVPEYRGKKTIFWAMFNGEREAGVTIQRVSAKLDRGDIIAAGGVTIGRALPCVVRGRVERLGFELYERSLEEVAAGDESPVSQPRKRKKLYRDPKPRDIGHFWLRYLRRLFRAGSAVEGPR